MLDLAKYALDQENIFDNKCGKAKASKKKLFYEET